MRNAPADRAFVSHLHDHSRRAVAALQAVAFPKTFLNRVQIAVRRKTFDRRDIRSVCLHREHGARFHGQTVKQDSARAANRSLTANVRAGESERIAQVMHEQHARLDFSSVIDTIDVNTDSLFHELPRFRYEILKRGLRKVFYASLRGKSIEMRSAWQKKERRARARLLSRA